MSALPPSLDRATHVDPDRRTIEPIVRWAGGAIAAAFVAAGLAGVFGQSPSSESARGALAALKVSAPTSLRGGLLYQARFEIVAREEIRAARLILDSGWFEGMQLNSVQPEPAGWGQESGRNVLELGRLTQGRTFVLRLQYQVNPTSIGRRDMDVALADGDRVLASISRTGTIFP